MGKSEEAKERLRRRRKTARMRGPDGHARSVQPNLPDVTNHGRSLAKLSEIWKSAKS